MCSLGAPPAGCSPAARARRRRDRVEKCYLLRAACAVLLDELTHGCYICGCWRKSGAACCRLSGQTPRTSSGCERGEARGEEDDGRDEEGDGGRGGVPQQKSRSAAACSITTDALPYRFRALPLDAVRLDVPREHRALDNQGACMATASAPPGADTLVRGQPHRLREPRICQGVRLPKNCVEPAARKAAVQIPVSRMRTPNRLQWRAYAAPEASCAHGQVDASERQGLVAE